MGAKLPAIPPQWDSDEGQGWSADGILGGIDPSIPHVSGFLPLDAPAGPETHPVLWRQLGLGAGGGLYARVPAIVDPAVTGINTTRSLFGVTVPRMDRASNIFGHILDSNTTKALLGASMAKKGYDAYQDYPAD